MKRCTGCGIEKAFDEFSPAARAVDGRQSRCKPCATRDKAARRQQLKARSPLELNAAFAAAEPTKRCPVCETSKPKAEFPRDRGKLSTLGQYCKPCSAAKSGADRAARPDIYRMRSKAEYGRNRETYKRGRLKQLFGLSLEQYQALLEKQGGVCAICKEPETLVRRTGVVMMSVDHCHDTGQVRALLCNACNRGLGFFRDNPRLLMEAAEYIRVHALIADLLPEGV